MAAAKKSSKAGHADHTQDAREKGLPGVFSRKIKVAFMGAGSFFTPRVLNDIMKTPGQAGGTFALVDLDERRLKLTAKMVRELVKGTEWKVTASTDRRKVLKGSDYVINCIEVSGAACVEMDNDIPLKYGVDQCIGDTIGPGGLFKALRTIPAWLGILKDCEELCPKALVLNYTNPMSMLCTAAGRASSMEVVGLCHSVQGTSNLLARYAGIPYEELEWECAGINHLAWFTTLAHKGKDLYPKLKKDFAAQIKKSLAEVDAGTVDAEWLSTWPGPRPDGMPEHHHDLIRKDMCLNFGAFITESSGHLSEYLPYYRKSEAGRKLLRCGYDGGSRFYATNWPDWRKHQDNQRTAILKGEQAMDWERSWEYASWIIEAREKNTPYRIHGNVMNQPRSGQGLLISNLPADQSVEVACLVDGNGVHPTRYGALPPQMAGLCASNLAMFGLAAEAAIHRSVETAVHALMLDPLTAAVCTPAQIREMTLEMFEAQKAFLPEYD
ncbi:MAG: alpha-glucosidase/alpha-galactosidase [Verrucomicrobia bacterium]|nr:alpha-glucosidase/alpha-galactosidase [Verrucomicrobiota bacterium]MCH8528358.1 alpha-glucosidase/alpha-galactosidase [Kiritimatiellia bacterium]